MGAYLKARQGSNFYFKKPCKCYEAILHSSTVSGEKKKTRIYFYSSEIFLERDYRSSAKMGSLQKHTPTCQHKQRAAREMDIVEYLKRKNI